MPKISVIVPVYKVEKYLNRCVDSILTQTFTDFECILVDDGSPDNCGKICDEYAKKDKRVKAIHKQNGGLSDARNKGIDWTFENSDSQWIAFIDSDDWVHTKYLELLYETAVNNNVKISSCGYIAVKDKKEDEKILDVTIAVDAPENMFKKGYKYCEYNFSIAWGRLYRKELFKNIRYPFGRLHEDEFTTYKLIYACDKVAVIEAPLYYYFQNEGGIMASEVSPKRMSDELDARKEQLDFFYSKKFETSFKNIFKVFCNLIEKYYREYGGRKEYASLLKAYRTYAEKSVKLYNEYLPDLLIKYGYRRWISGKALKIDVLRCDYNNVRKEKGLVRALLWVIKNGISVYFGG